MMTICSHSSASPDTGTNAVIPYREMDRMVRIAAEADTNKIIVHARAAAPKESQLKLTIQSANAGPIPIEIDTHGGLKNFPRLRLGAVFCRDSGTG